MKKNQSVLFFIMFVVCVACSSGCSNVKETTTGGLPNAYTEEQPFLFSADIYAGGE